MFYCWRWLYSVQGFWIYLRQFSLVKFTSSQVWKKKLQLTIKNISYIFLQCNFPFSMWTECSWKGSMTLIRTAKVICGFLSEEYKVTACTNNFLYISAFWFSLVVWPGISNEDVAYGPWTIEPLKDKKPNKGLLEIMCSKHKKPTICWLIRIREHG